MTLSYLISAFKYSPIPRRTGSKDLRFFPRLNCTFGFDEGWDKITGNDKEIPKVYHKLALYISAVCQLLKENPNRIWSMGRLEIKYSILTFFKLKTINYLNYLFNFLVYPYCFINLENQELIIHYKPFTYLVGNLAFYKWGAKNKVSPYIWV